MIKKDFNIVQSESDKKVEELKDRIKKIVAIISKNGKLLTFTKQYDIEDYYERLKNIFKDICEPSIQDVLIFNQLFDIPLNYLILGEEDGLPDNLINEVNKINDMGLEKYRMIKGVTIKEIEKYFFKILERNILCFIGLFENLYNSKDKNTRDFVRNLSDLKQEYFQCDTGYEELKYKNEELGFKLDNLLKGKRILALRTLEKETQKEFSATSGIGSSLALIETGQRSLNEKNVRKMDSYLSKKNITQEFILNGRIENTHTEEDFELFINELSILSDNDIADLVDKAKKSLRIFLASMDKEILYELELLIKKDTALQLLSKVEELVFED